MEERIEGEGAAIGALQGGNSGAPVSVSLPGMGGEEVAVGAGHDLAP